MVQRFIFNDEHLNGGLWGGRALARRAETCCGVDEAVVWTVRQQIVQRQKVRPDDWLGYVSDDEIPCEIAAQVFGMNIQTERAVGLDAGVIGRTELEGRTRTLVVQEGPWIADDVGTAVDEEPPLSDLVGDENTTASRMAARGRLYGLPLVFS